MDIDGTQGMDSMMDTLRLDRWTGVERMEEG